MDSHDSLPDMSNAMEWESDRLVLGGRFDLELFICRSGLPGGPKLPLPHQWYILRFATVASPARVRLSLMWQYYDDEEPHSPLLEELQYDGDRTFVEGFTVNTESYGNSWKKFRIITQEEVLEVIADSAPIVTRWQPNNPPPPN